MATFHVGKWRPKTRPGIIFEWCDSALTKRGRLCVLYLALKALNIPLKML